MALRTEDFFEVDPNDGERPMFTYDGELDQDIINVLREMKKHKAKWDHNDFGHGFYTEIAKDLNLCPKYVQLINHYLAYIDFADYGTSPRGAFISDKGEIFLRKWGLGG